MSIFFLVSSYLLEHKDSQKFYLYGLVQREISNIRNKDFVGFV